MKCILNNALRSKDIRFLTASYLPAHAWYLLALASYLPALASYLPALASYLPAFASYRCFAADKG